MCFLQLVFPVNRVLLAGQGAGLTQARAAAEPGPGGDAGVPLLVGERVAVLPGGGAETGAGAELRRCARVAGPEVTPPDSFAAAHEPYPIAAPAALAGGVAASPRRRAERAATANALGSGRQSHIRHHATGALTQAAASGLTFQQEPVAKRAAQGQDPSPIDARPREGDHQPGSDGRKRGRKRCGLGSR